jgi:hypothetical protein
VAKAMSTSSSAKRRARAANARSPGLAARAARLRARGLERSLVH